MLRKQRFENYGTTSCAGEYNEAMGSGSEPLISLEIAFSLMETQGLRYKLIIL